MSNLKCDVLGIGNAIVDVLVQSDDAFLEREGINKGSMTLIDASASKALYDKVGPAVECSGGSAANTIACLASLGGSGSFVGKVRDDQLGHLFRHDIQSLGVSYNTKAAVDGPSTASCIVMVTPDAQRTMNTYLGACVDLTADDIDPEEVAAAKVTYMEGYLWDPEEAKKAFLKASAIAHDAGRQVSLSLSDPFCVGRHRAEFLDLVENHVDILFANEEEIISLYEVDKFEDAVKAVNHHCDVAALTRGAAGSVIVTKSATYEVGAAPVREIVDTTGAGDAFAAGYLYGHTQGLDPVISAGLGGVAASHIIAHLGARPRTPLSQLVTGLIR